MTALMFRFIIHYVLNLTCEVPVNCKFNVTVSGDWSVHRSELNIIARVGLGVVCCF